MERKMKIHNGFKNKAPVNNNCYDTFGAIWYEEGSDHPIALLRAEHKTRLPWMQQEIDNHFGKKTLQIIDIGCGGGIVSNTLALQGHKVTGVDTSEPSLAIAREKDSTKNVHYLKANALDLPFEDQMFDLVCSMDFLEHVDNPALAIKEASRVLKPNGLFFFHTFNRNLISYIVVIKGVEWFVKKTPKNLHVYDLFIKPKELVQMGKDNELELKSIQGLSPKCSFPLLKMLFTRKVPHNLEFKFTSSTVCGYVGFFSKLSLRFRS